MTNFHLTGTLRGTDVTESWIVDGSFESSAPQGPLVEVSGFIYPALVDSHAHIGLSHGPEPVSHEEMLRRLASARTQGVGVIREMGAQSDASEVAALGRTKVIRSGRHLARAKRYLRYLPLDVAPRALPDAAYQQAQAGDGWVKIVGDWIDRRLGADSDLAPLWPTEVLIDAVAAAHEAGAKVAVHAFAVETIDGLLEAGVDSIEHGSGMNHDHLLEAARRGVLIDPTMRQISCFSDFATAGGKYPVYQARMRAMHRNRVEHFQEMIDVGAALLMGSDSAEDIGENGLLSEIEHCVAAGMDPSQAMKTASFDARARLGLPSWEAGSPGDVVVYNEDPEADISAVRRPKMVLIDGVECAYSESFGSEIGMNPAGMSS